MNKQILSALIVIFVSLNLYAQIPQNFNYQSALRDAAGEILSNSNVIMRFSFRQTNAIGPIRYQETHNTSTNEFGLVNLEIGKGTVTQFSWSNLYWDSFNYVLQVEVNLGNGFVDMGTSAFSSVPFAILSERSTNMSVGDLTDVETYMGVSNGDVLKFNADENYWEPGRSSLNDLSDVNYEELPQNGDQLVYSDYFAEWVPSSVTGRAWEYTQPDVAFTTNKVGIGIAEPQVALAVNGFTQLGENAPKIKMVTLTASYPGGIFGGEPIPVAHGIPDVNKIISVSVVELDIFEGIVRNPPSGLGYVFDATNVTVYYDSIVGGTVQLTVFYTE